MEVVLFLLGLPCALVFLIGPLLGVLAFFSMRDLSRRLERLEEMLAKPTSERVPVRKETTSQPLRAELATEPESQPLHAERVTEPEPVPVLAALPAQEPTPSPSEAPKKRQQRSAAEPLAWESLLGARVLGWIAAGFLLLAFGYFIAYAVQNVWIGPVGQISLGLAAGLLTCLLGAWVHRRGYPLGLMLVGTGFVMFYLALFASYGGYALLPATRGVLYQMVLVALGVGLAGLYPARSLAVMALVGGLITPLLVPSERDQYEALFGYLLLLETAMLVLSLWRGWTWLPPVALIGVQILFGLWADRHYHPEKLAAVLGLQATLFGLHLLHDVGVPVLRRQPAQLGRLVGLIVATLAFAQAVVVYPYGEMRPWLPLLAVGLALLMVLLANAVKRRLAVEREPLYFTLLALGLVFVAAAPALRLTGTWIGLAWAVLGLLLWAYALRVEALPLAVCAAVLLALAVLVELPAYFSSLRWSSDQLQVPLFNELALPPFLVVLTLWLAAWQLRSVQGTADDLRWWVWLILVGVGILLGWLIFSLEVQRFNNNWLGPRVRQTVEGRLWSMMSLSIAWAVYAGLVMAAGFWRASPTLRGIGLALLGLAILKGVLIDMSVLSGMYRIGAFFILALVLGGIALTYQRLERAGLLGKGTPS